MTDEQHPSLDDQMGLAIRAMAHHSGGSWRTDRTGWTQQQWIEDADALMSDIDGSVMSLVNGHATALLAFWETHRDRVVALTREQAIKAGVVTGCREWPDGGERCDKPAEFVLWGKLFAPEALGPRCYDHAVQHAGSTMPSRVDQYAVIDLRPFRKAVQQ